MCVVLGREISILVRTGNIFFPLLVIYICAILMRAVGLVSHWAIRMFRFGLSISVNVSGWT